MENGWIKFHRKILESDVFQDQTAWRIFTWLLLKVDRETGKKNIGRFWASKELKMNPNTFYKALLRLQNRYMNIKIVTNKVTIKYSEIEIINWSKYQSSNTSGEQSSNNPVTIQEQSSNTLQEDKNKELRIKKEEEIEKIPNRLILSRGMVIAYCKEFPGITSTEVEEQRLKCNAYMNMSSSNYTNPGLFFKGWLKKYLIDKKIKKSEKASLEEIESHLPKISEEARQRNLSRLDEIRKNLKSRLVVNE